MTHPGARLPNPAKAPPPTEMRLLTESGRSIRRKGFRSSVPLSLLWSCNNQALDNHGQDLLELAITGGVTPAQLAALLEGRPFREMASADAYAVIDAQLPTECPQCSDEAIRVGVDGATGDRCWVADGWHDEDGDLVCVYHCPFCGLSLPRLKNAVCRPPWQRIGL